MLIDACYRVLCERRLKRNYNQENFVNFMKSETYRYTEKYANNRVNIHNPENVSKLLKGNGIVLTCLHYGSFFLTGPALASQMNLISTGIVTHSNLLILEKKDADFWRGVHRRIEVAQKEKFFYAGRVEKNKIVSFLNNPQSILWAMIDVREAGRDREEYPLIFQDKTYYFQIGPAKLACLSNVPYVPTCIKYDLKSKKHNLYIGTPIMPTISPLVMTQLALNQISQMIGSDHTQFFHDLNYFSTPKTQLL